MREYVEKNIVEPIGTENIRPWSVTQCVAYVVARGTVDQPDAEVY